jgi:hypothetical protein
MNGYKCFYRNQTVEVYAETTYKAQCIAAEKLKVPPKKQGQITVVLCERPDGSTVTHTAVD